MAGANKHVTTGNVIGIIMIVIKLKINMILMNILMKT
jgi:hypothetical protein